MTSREIIIKLVDEHLINGEEAFTLINDIVAAEIKEALETINAAKKANNNKGGIEWKGNGSDSIWVSANPGWTYTYPSSTYGTITTDTITASSLANSLNHTPDAEYTCKSDV